MPEQRGGRPIAASQRPTGGDKAIATGKKQYFRRKKVCRFCVEKVDDINYKDVKDLNSFMSERGKITPRQDLGSLYAAPKAFGGSHQTGAQYRLVAVRLADVSEKRRHRKSWKSS